MNKELIIQLNNTMNNNSSTMDIVLPYGIIFICIIMTIYYIININLLMTKTDWNKNKCVPKYMFISGFIKKEPGLNILGSINKNFKQCVKDTLILTNTIATNSELNRRRVKRLNKLIKRNNKKNNN
jgi:hypothetical protein